MTERVLINQILLAASRWGARLLRNNCGMVKTHDGRVIRYGVGNPGGSDLLGWYPITITQDMVGKKIAVFLAVEVKTARVRLTGNQENFLRVIREAGGIAIEARDPVDLRKALEACDGGKRKD